MGFCSSEKTEMKVMIVGISGAGKTSITKTISGEIMGASGYKKPIPTYGFDIKSILFEDTSFQIWDIGGSPDQKPFWSTYVDDQIDALIYVIDGSS